MLSKKDKLLVSMYSVLQHPSYIEKFRSIQTALELTEEIIRQEFLHYNCLDTLYLQGREIYRSLGNRVVLHIHNLIENSWHTDRQTITRELVQLADPKTMIDIGFGVPTKYIKDCILDTQKTKLTLCDIYDSAFQFAEVLLDLWGLPWRHLITFKQTDMDTQEYVGDFDLYLFQDAIEHTVDPTTYLKKHVNLSPKHAKFIVSLPIGPLVPGHHFMAWASDLEATTWLETCGLKIEHMKSVFVNPKVDLFADLLAEDYHDIYMLCSKKG